MSRHDHPLELWWLQRRVKSLARVRLNSEVTMKACFALVLAIACGGCISIGAGSVRVVDRDDDAHAEAVAKVVALAAGIAGQLRELEGSLGRWEECLNRASCSPQQFLSAAESAELKILAAPELAALRDWVQQGYRAAERQLESGGTGATGARYRPAALREGPTPVQSAPTSGLVARVRGLISRPRELAENDDLITDICVVSTPSEASFLMWPSSEPSRQWGTRTTGRVVKVSRGSYAFSLTKGSLTYACPNPAKPCPKLDLVGDRRPVFDCALDGSGCKRLERVAAGCRD